MGWMWKSPKPQTTERPDELMTNYLPVSSTAQSGRTEHKSQDSLHEATLQSNYNEEIRRPDLQNISDTQYNDTTSKSSLQDQISISEYLLPGEISCREAFDSAFYCTSLGGAFNHLYRYGTVRSCSEHWNKFWFCMRTRTLSEEAKETSIKEYYRNVEKAKYGKHGTSSEDIWKTRDQLVEKGTAFCNDEGEWNGTDEEWRAAVLNMRKRMIEAKEVSKT